MRIALLCPTRARAQHVVAMVQSALQKADAPSDLEFLFRFDDDDTQKQETEAALSAIGAFTSLTGPRLEGYPSLPVFYNELAKMTDAEILGLTNDDVRFTLQGWDTRVREAIGDPLHDLRIVTGRVGEHPFITRRFYKVLGQFSDVDDPSCDAYLTHIADRTSTRAIIPEFFESVVIHDATGEEKIAQFHAQHDRYTVLAESNKARANGVRKVKAALRRATKQTLHVVPQPQPVASQEATIALLCPTRGRPEGLRVMMQSALEQADHPEQVRFYLKFDPDDTTKEEADTYIEPYRNQTVAIVTERGRGYADLAVYFNDLALLTQHESILGLLNDDCVFVQKGWDTTLQTLLSTFKDGIALALGPEEFAFTFITRRWYETAGYFCHPEEAHIDTFLADIGRSLQRVVTTPMIMEHRRVQDRTTEEVQQSALEANTPGLYDSPEHRAWREKTIERLRACCL